MRRFLCILLALVMAASLLPAVQAYSGPAVSSNINDHFYINAGRYYHPVYSNLSCENGQYVRAEAIGSNLVVETYDQSFQFLSGKSIPLELPIFGGVRMDSDYNFVVVGQNNPNEDDSVEVFRIIRYTKDWQKVDHASLFGANTYIPFDAGSLRFDRSGDILYIRTSHEMYASYDGSHHQANVMIALRISDMTVTDQLTKVWNNSYGYVSHSFNQFVRVDGDTLLAVDHGDAGPRSVVLFKYTAKAGSETFYSKTDKVNALPIAYGTTHYNDTGVSVGGFECSSTDYLIAGSAYDMSEKVDLMYAHRNIFVTATPKDNFTDEGTSIHWLTSYTADDGVRVSPPHLLKLNSDQFFLTWTENGILKYCFLNGKGELESSINTGSGDLSDCEPILDGERIIWYVTNSSAPVFHQISVNFCRHSYQPKVTQPTCTEQGYTTYTCTACGDSYTADYTDALGHDWELDACIRCGGERPNPFTDTDPSRFYYLPVLWAVDNDITQGTGNGKFSPEGTCTRAQVVTFLWRAAGSPDPRSSRNPFTDVTQKDYYYKAVLWAVEKGITQGTSATAFSPNAPCNRAQVVTFLWRAKGSPAPKTEKNPFLDVTEERYYHNAVLWAVETGITSGVSATAFRPDNPCTRGQVVTFLYRTFA